MVQCKSRCLHLRPKTRPLHVPEETDSSNALAVVLKVSFKPYVMPSNHSSMAAKKISISKFKGMALVLI